MASRSCSSPDCRIAGAACSATVLALAWVSGSLEFWKRSRGSTTRLWKASKTAIGRAGGVAWVPGSSEYWRASKTAQQARATTQQAYGGPKNTNMKRVGCDHDPAPVTLQCKTRPTPILLFHQPPAHLLCTSRTARVAFKRWPPCVNLTPTSGRAVNSCCHSPSSNSNLKPPVSSSFWQGQVGLHGPLCSQHCCISCSSCCFGLLAADMVVECSLKCVWH
jgi:hypothetical protein